METFRQFDRDPNHKNWLKGIMVLEDLQDCLKPFIEDETEKLHEDLRNICGPRQCDNNCNPKYQGPNQNPVFNCDVCPNWRKEIQNKHKSGKLMWKNSEAHEWSRDKWAVSKVYMPDGHKKHNSIDDFDIHSFLTLINQCKNFQRFELGELCNKVLNVRNRMMHSPRYQLDQEDLLDFLDRIRDLGDQLSKKNSGFKKLAEDINEILNLNFRLVETEELERMENAIYTAVQLANEYRDNQDSLNEVVVKLEQCISERDSQILVLRQRNKTQQKKHDWEIQRLQSALVHETTEHRNTKVQLENLHRELQEEKKMRSDEQKYWPRWREFTWRNWEIQNDPVKSLIKKEDLAGGLFAVLGGLLLALFAILK
ncbi:uncharacterized protein CXorf38-like [Centropristis striata]|uniref:uncharacterized protein CXorf38-like n=1 Tax=Centropristis striata TaxID=184440 RepID=UPI0027E065BA|nr:uncharacterized protein CXorf38-like [Centropristis striata]